MTGDGVDRRVEAGAERIEDLLTMLGVDPNERQVEDVHGVDTPMGDDVKTIIASAVLAAADAVDDRDREIKQLREERQVVLDCVNLYGDETLHSALDAIGFVPRAADAVDDRIREWTITNIGDPPGWYAIATTRVRRGPFSSREEAEAVARSSGAVSQGEETNQ